MDTALGSDQLDSLSVTNNQEKTPALLLIVLGRESSFNSVLQKKRNEYIPSVGIDPCTSPHASPCPPSASVGLWGSRRTP